MKKVLVLVCAALMTAACCNSGSKKCDKSGEACCKDSAKTCCKADGKACCKAEPQKLITAHFYVKPDKTADFLAATKSLIDGSRAEEGNVSYELFQDPANNGTFVFVEQWKSQAAIDTHFKAPHFTGFGDATKDWLAKPADIVIFDVFPTKKAE